MKFGITVLFTGFMGVFGYSQVSDQHQVIGAAGNEILGNSKAHGSITFTIGEIGVQTMSSATDPVQVTEGFHQTYFLVNEVADQTTPNFIIKVWPNPTARFLNIDLGELSNQQTIKAEIVDVSGTVLEEFLPSEKTKIDLLTYPVSTYFLKIYQEETAQMSVFQIIKN